MAGWVYNKGRNINTKNMLLQDKVAIVTGAWQGIGKGIALALAREGCQVAVADVNETGCQETVS